MPYLLHPSLRGAVSGLGALDIRLARSMLRRRSDTAETHSNYHARYSRTRRYENLLNPVKKPLTCYVTDRSALDSLPGRRPEGALLGRIREAALADSTGSRYAKKIATRRNSWIRRATQSKPPEAPARAF